MRSTVQHRATWHLFACGAADRTIQSLGYTLCNSHVKRFADAFEALAVARFPFVGEEDMNRVRVAEQDRLTAAY